MPVMQEGYGDYSAPPNQGHRPWIRRRNERALRTNNFPLMLGKNSENYISDYTLLLPKRRILVVGSHGPGGVLPPSGCFASEKTPKAPKEKACFHSRCFCVFDWPVDQYFSVPQAACGKNGVYPAKSIRKPESRGGTPLARFTGAAKAPAWYALQLRWESSW